MQNQGFQSTETLCLRSDKIRTLLLSVSCRIQRKGTLPDGSARQHHTGRHLSLTAGASQIHGTKGARLQSRGRSRITQVASTSFPAYRPRLEQHFTEKRGILGDQARSAQDTSALITVYQRASLTIRYKHSGYEHTRLQQLTQDKGSTEQAWQPCHTVESSDVNW